jgi:hypothetical protein
MSKMHRLLLILSLLFISTTWRASGESATVVSPKTDRLIWKVARQEGVDPYLLRAIVAIESAFNPRSISHKGAVGLMQLMPKTARELGVTNRYNPEQNLRGGARYLKKMIKRFSNIRLALAAYNAGPANVDRFKGIPPFAETRKYVGNVLKNYSKIKPGTNSSPKRIYRYKKPNGTLVLTSRRQFFNYSAEWDYTQQYRKLKRTPLLSIKRSYSKLKTARMAPDIPAKPRFNRPAPKRKRNMARLSATKIPVIQLASLSVSEEGPLNVTSTRMVVGNEGVTIPIIRLSRQ